MHSPHSNLKPVRTPLGSEKIRVDRLIPPTMTTVSFMAYSPEPIIQ